VRAAFTGSAPLTFMDYIDGETGRTLTAVPGGVYEVVPVAAHPVPEVPPGFVPVEEKPAKAAKSKAADDGEQASA
jgi:hypothetical protein